MSTRPLWRRDGKWRRPARAQRRAAALAKVLTRPPLTPTGKPRPRRPCSPATPRTPATQTRSSSSRTEWRGDGRSVTDDDPSHLECPQHVPEVMSYAFTTMSCWSFWNLPLREFFSGKPSWLSLSKSTGQRMLLWTEHLLYCLAT